MKFNFHNALAPKTLVLASAIALMAPVAQADDDSGFYIGAAYNRLSADFEDENDLDFDDSDNAGSLQLGYMFNDNIGIEAGYLNLGNYSAEGSSLSNRIEIDADAFTAAVRLSFSPLEYLDVYGKLGAFQVEVDSASFVAGDVLLDGDDETTVYAAAGVAFDIGPVDLFAEYSKVDTDISDLTIDIATVGVRFEFGSY